MAAEKDIVERLREWAPTIEGFSLAGLAANEIERLRGLVLPETLTPAVREVLGLMNFRTGPLAHVYQAAGHEIPKRCEDEQAFVLHRFLLLAIKHGADWHKASVADVDAALAVAKERAGK
jgi:hypothetical protein